AVVAGSGGCHAFHFAFAEIGPVRRPAARFAIGDERGGGGAGAGNGANYHTDQAAANDAFHAALELGKAEADPFGLDLDMGLGFLEVELHDFRDGKQPDQQRDEGDAIHQVVVLEGQALGAVDHVQADGRQENAQAGRNQALDHRVARHGNDHGQRETDQPEELRGPEVERDLGQVGGKEDQRNVRDEVGDDRGIQCRLERLLGMALLGQRVAVQQCAGGGGRAWGANQDGGDRAAIHAALVDADEQQDRGDRLHREGKGQRQRHRHGGGQPRYRTDDDTEKYPNASGDEVIDAEEDSEYFRDIFHRTPSRSAIGYLLSKKK